MIPLSLEQIAQAMGTSAALARPTDLVLRVSIDSRETKPGDLYVAIRGQRHDGHAFVREAFERGALAAVVSEPNCFGEALGGRRLLVRDTVAALGDLASYYREEIMPADTRVVAITGSNGKTTTKCMLDHVLSETFPGRCAPRSFNNHIGVPLTLLSAEPGDRYLVVEIGSNAAGEVAALAQMSKPDVGVVTSVGHAHLDGLGDVAGVAREKCSLLRSVRPDGLAVVNVDQATVRAGVRGGVRAGVSCRLITVGEHESANLRVVRLSQSLDRSMFSIGECPEVSVPMPGLHHGANVAAVFAVARWFGLSWECIIERLGSYVTEAGRANVIRVGGVALIDDTYNANPTSMSAAIDALASLDARRRVLVMGDMLELGPNEHPLHEEVLRRALAARFGLVVVLGAAMKKATKAQGVAGSVLVCDELNEVCLIVRRFVKPGDAVWLKGSRAMRLDRAVEYLQRELGARSAVA